MIAVSPPESGKRSIRIAIGTRSGELAAALLIAIVFSVVFIESYAWSDDYPLLLAPRASFREWASEGRLVSAPLTYASFDAAGSIGGLRYVRAFSVLGLALLAAQLVSALRTLGVSSGQAVFLAVTALLLPPFQMYAGWATAWLFSWGCLLSAWGAVHWLGARTRTERWVGFTSLVVANLIYQPAAFFAWAIAGIQLARAINNEQSFKDAGRLLLVTIASAATAFLLAVVVNAAFGVAWEQRSVFVTTALEIRDKVQWVLTRPVVIGARPFLIGSPTPWEALLTAGPVLVLLGYDWMTRANGTLLRKSLSALTLIGILVLAMLPNLVVRENQIDFRVLPGVCVVMWWYLYVAMFHLVERFDSAYTGRLGRRLGAAAQIAFVVFVAVIARQNIATTMVRPNQRKDAYIATQLQQFDPARHSRIVVVNDPDWWGRRRELGSFSLISDLALFWVPVADVRLKAREAGIEVGRVDVRAELSASQTPPDTLVIDFAALR